ncbi:glycoside hydrolase family 16 protein [Spirilliplanes yamanashiensis]|uniref:Hydrolase n=1 Tax=Spirilliplanes yamanashiensis TaxID=42233 RepID=A0A8J3YEV8_9ACTN|nr:glycoside hydrolase family 16 protein [Spirilliplanes yamanashiensis]MDP9815244.1 beta-glucanase (GH16 family) [Spirilliplanes yamanashiensis]GIJ06487.1 hydrolase [Spirilliplanes yamanashiensis]
MPSKARPRTLVLAAVAVLGLTAALYLPGRADDAEAAVGAQTWSDEFNGAAGTPVDAGKWTMEVAGHGFGNNERQYYTNSTRNAAHDGNGNMVITARRENPNNYQCHYGRCEYTSARLITSGKFTQRYGRFEARIKVPRGQGIWPAFWMLGHDIGSVGWPNSGEIDIMENIGREPNTVHGTIHGPGYSGGAGLLGSRTVSRPLADAFHTYAVEWSPDLIRWMIDGSEYHRVTPASLGGRQWVFNKPFFLLLNVAVGGDWPGFPDGSTQFPQQMLIDWVRVRSWTTGGTPPPAGDRLRQAHSGRCIDIPGSNAADGAKLQIWNCNTTAAQRWTFHGDGTVRAMGKCMDPAWAGTADGTEVNLVTCNGNPAQRFTLSGAGDLVNISADKCVDVRNRQTSNGGKLHLWTCHGGSSQKWSRY